MHNFDIFFAGKLTPDADPSEAREAVGKLFKLQGQALEKLFSGTPVRIKKAVDVETANRYRKAFRNAGALIDIVPHQAASVENAAPEQAMAPPATTAQPPAEKTVPAADTSADMTLLPANTGSLEDCAPQVEARQIPDIGWMNLDMPGIDLDETPPAPAKQVDTSALSLSDANTGSLEDCREDKPAREIPDISGMTMSDANSGSLKDCDSRKPAQPIPDISHLQMVSPEDEKSS